MVVKYEAEVYIAKTAVSGCMVVRQVSSLHAAIYVGFLFLLALLFIFGRV